MPSQRSTLVLVALAGFGCLVSGVTLAAPLSFSTAETVSLSSPATNLTIATDSAADGFEVNATSVIVTLSSSTGRSFAILSPAFDLVVASSSSGGTVTTSCTAGVVSTTIA